MKSYLPLAYQILMLVVLLVLWRLGVELWVPIGLVLGIVYLFRRRGIVLEKDVVGVRAPISGKVKTIIQKDGFIEVEIVVPWWAGMGIHLPFYAELTGRTEKRDKGWGMMLSLEEVGSHKKWELFFEKRPWGGFPSIAIAPGDRGAPGVDIGYFMMGGGVRIRFLSADCRLLIRRGDSLVAGKTLVCG